MQPLIHVIGKCWIISAQRFGQRRRSRQQIQAKTADLEPDDIFVCEGACKEQQCKALHLGHGSEALQLFHHLLSKGLHCRTVSKLCKQCQGSPGAEYLVNQQHWMCLSLGDRLRYIVKEQFCVALTGADHPT